ncbi:DNA repair protein rad2, partial [Kappamyces sp. JEL0829]
MGVSQLWTILEPSAKTVQLESLSGKKVAVDASIWLYQFMKAMRDPNGEVLHGAHLVGFLRRICKLLYYGIRPVFVFDGSVPELKRETIAKRRRRKGEAVEAVERTAQKLLNARLKLIALTRAQQLEQEAVDEAYFEEDHKPVPLPAGSGSLVVADVVRDEYELPNPTRQPNALEDFRLPTEEELFEFISGHRHDIDLNKVNINSEEFKSLSLEKQHEIILGLKNASRTPSQARVEGMLAASRTSKDFSVAQIKNLVHRAVLTDRYHSTLKQEGADSFVRRVNGARQKDFILKKNESSEKGGYMLETQTNAPKVVADLKGLQGFGNVEAKVKLVPIAASRTLDEVLDDANNLDQRIFHDFTYVDDDVDDEALWQKIVEAECRLTRTPTDKLDQASSGADGIKAPSKSGLEDFLVPLSEEAPLESVPGGLDGTIEAWKTNAPLGFFELYPDFDSAVVAASLAEDADWQKLLETVKKRAGKSSPAHAKCH